MENLTGSIQLQSLAESHGKDWGKRFGQLLICANKQFGRISPTKSNRNILLQTLGNSDLRKAIVKRLEEGEKDWDFDARFDTTIRAIVEAFKISLPKNPDDIQRWTMLVTASTSIIEGFSYGNLIRPEDFT
jgi:hypothetical protein